MTHDELLAVIESNADAWAEPSFNANALRSVVELHEPMDIGKNLTVCRECFTIWENNPYPCSTIEAIEKKLEQA
jgi:hypothetical protein